MDIVRRTWTEVSLNAIEHNFNEIKNKVGNRKICCVVKADGYGHGAVELSKEYEKLGADFLAVSNIDEGKELREDGVTLPIVILGYTPAVNATELVNNNLSQAVYSLDYAQMLNENCRKLNKKVKIHIKLDTGMSRIGFMCQEFPRDDYSVREIKEVCELEHLQLEGLFTHFCVSDEGEEGREFTNEQYKNFNIVLDKLKEIGIIPPIVHCSNSGAIEDYPGTYCDMVRAGIILYGLSPSGKLNGRLNLIPAMTLKTSVAYVKYIEKGATISYGRTYEAQKKMKIATVPIGYADGFIRKYANDGYMMIKGKKAPIVGRVCMDQTMLDVTDIENVKIGDEVIVFGDGSGDSPTADTLALSADTINYEIVCLISKRVPRVFVKDGKVIDIMYKL
ncbi:MAG: alanine racemase [Ruminococcus sp.]|nr:alanine racemase [Ruminococcus sp.]